VLLSDCKFNTRDVAVAAFDDVETSLVCVEVLEVGASHAHPLSPVHYFHLHPNVSRISRGKCCSTVLEDWQEFRSSPGPAI